MWSATSRVAGEILFANSAGDMASDSPELSKPASLAGSTRKLARRADIDAGQIANRIVEFRIAQTAGKDNARVARVPLGFELLGILDPSDNARLRLSARASSSRLPAASRPLPTAAHELPDAGIAAMAWGESNLPRSSFASGFSPEWHSKQWLLRAAGQSRRSGAPSRRLARASWRLDWRPASARKKRIVM
jgi:hypothetical protein